MILSSIGKILRIRKIESEDGVDGLFLRLEGVPDGTSIEIMRTCDSHPFYAEFKNEVAHFAGSCVSLNSDYRISFQNTAGDLLVTYFTVREGVLRRKVGPLDAELTSVWEALLTLVDEIRADEEKLESVVDGFISE